MSWNLIYILVLAFIGFGLARLALGLLPKQNIQTLYSLRRDPWLYMFMLMTCGFVALYFWFPLMADAIFPLTLSALIVPLILALLVYVMFLLEIDWLYYLTIAAVCTAAAFTLPETALMFEGVLPWWLDHLTAGFILMLFTFTAMLLNGIAGVFAIQCLTITSGLAVVALIGGAPMVLGFLAAYLGGIWLGYLNLNWYPAKVYLNSGACAAGAFILGWLCLRASIEYAGPSMLILAMFAAAELLWAVAQRVFHYQRQVSWEEETAYGAAYEKGVTEPAIGVAMFKIAIVNLILACFQLYAPNPFSIPLFALLINLWLLNILYKAPDAEKTFAQTNAEVIKTLKDGLEDAKKSLQKDKD